MNPAHTFSRLVAAACVGVACLLVGTFVAGCAGTADAPRLAKGWKDAEIAVTNLTPYAWSIALLPAKGAETKLVQVQPRETFAVVLPGGDYRVEQTLLASDVAGGTRRNFTARFEPGERYRWSLATVLAADDAVSP